MQAKPIHFDVIVIGAGAAGLMCASLVGKSGKSVLLLDKANKPGKKILMSGGGRCNFTNLNITYDNYLSHNRHFFKSALSRYTQWDFINLVEQYGIEYYEKSLGQLFCVGKSRLIVDMLLSECDKAKVSLKLKQEISSVSLKEKRFVLNVNGKVYQCDSLVVASGGLSIPTMGASPFGYELARQFGLNVYQTTAGLVPYTLHLKDKARYEELSGISLACTVTCNGMSFNEQLLFTHRGLSGPAILQISSYWQPGNTVTLCLEPNLDIKQFLKQATEHSPLQRCKTALATHFAKRLLAVFVDNTILEKPLNQLATREIEHIIKSLQDWNLVPNGTEGYRTAEVTLGGVDCDELSSKTFESKLVPGLYFIGEVVDVTGWLGGYNFQWAWSSAYACANSLEN